MDKDNDLVLPKTVTELLELLNNLYPEKTPDLEETPKDIYFKAGQRDVVRFLNFLKERADKEAIL
jgi:hypothetical protein|tara:strand:- start:172 stop:366 length:195 start_codon:yes stop_codon:yes gene_type:complete